MEPDQPGPSGRSEASETTEAAEPAAAPLSMLDAVGRLSPEQAGLFGVLLGLRRLSDDPPETPHQI